MFGAELILGQVDPSQSRADKPCTIGGVRNPGQGPFNGQVSTGVGPVLEWRSGGEQAEASWV